MTSEEALLFQCSSAFREQGLPLSTEKGVLLSHGDQDDEVGDQVFLVCFLVLPLLSKQGIIEK